MSNTMEEVTSRIAELDNAKAALLQQAADLEAKRDEASTFENLMNANSKGHKILENISAELFAIADRLRRSTSLLRPRRRTCGWPNWLRTRWNCAELPKPRKLTHANLRHSFVCSTSICAPPWTPGYQRVNAIVPCE